ALPAAGRPSCGRIAATTVAVPFPVFRPDRAGRSRWGSVRGAGPSPPPIAWAAVCLPAAPATVGVCQPCASLLPPMLTLLLLVDIVTGCDAVGPWWGPAAGVTPGGGLALVPMAPGG